MIHLRHSCGVVVGFRAVGCFASYVAVFYSADKVAELDRCPLCRADLYEALRTGALQEVEPVNTPAAPGQEPA